MAGWDDYFSGAIPENGMTAAEIARRVGLCEGRIKQIVREDAIKARNAALREREKAIRAAEREQLLALQNTTRAQQFGRSAAYLWNVLEWMQIELQRSA